MGELWPGCVKEKRSQTTQTQYSLSRYRLLMSDGQYYNSFFMLASQLNSLIYEKQLEQFTVINKVKSYICNNNANVDQHAARVTVILGLEILAPAWFQVGRKIGNCKLANNFLHI